MKTQKYMLKRLSDNKRRKIYQYALENKRLYYQGLKRLVENALWEHNEVEHTGVLYELNDQVPTTKGVIGFNERLKFWSNTNEQEVEAILKKCIENI